MPLLAAGAVFLAEAPAGTAAEAQWQMAAGRLQTPWAAAVSPTNALAEYPRPQMVRSQWRSLNGVWDCATTPKDSGRPDSFPYRILVPFPVESALSGVMKTLTEKDRIWYRKQFEVPVGWKGKRVLLHFGAVDFEAVVSLNGRGVGRHRGGYDAFTL